MSRRSSRRSSRRFAFLPTLSAILATLLPLASHLTFAFTQNEPSSPQPTHTTSVEPKRTSGELPANAHTQPILLYSAGQRQNSFQDCRDLFPQQLPLSPKLYDTRWRPRALCSDAFAVLHSGLSKTPLVVVERLTRAHVMIAKGEKRTDKFYADPRLPKQDRAQLDDYRRSGWSRGHLAPAANAASPKAMAQSFALSNMVPQDMKFNSGAWNKIEDSTRKYVLRARGDVFVYSGALFDAGYQTIGRKRVHVPTRMYKLVYDASTKRAWAHVMPNHASAKQHTPMNYERFVKTTGLHLLPPGAL